MKERVYIGDWLYNAGIVGFLNINSHLWELKEDRLLSKDKDVLYFGDNYIEFDRRIFEGFAKRFFDYAFEQYGRYESLLKLFNEYIEDLKALNNKEDLGRLNKKYFNEKLKGEEIATKLPNELLDRLKKILNGFSFLKNRIGKVPTKNEIKNDPSVLVSTLIKAIEIMKENKGELWESDVQIYLRKIYGQKSFLNRSVNKNRFDKFYKDFEEPLSKNKTKRDPELRCIFCMERKAKSNTLFDTGISKFYGLNPDSINFVWNFAPKLPLCDICEITYFSYFAGLTPVRRDNKTIFYFVNSDSSIYDLVKENLLLKNVLTMDVSQNALLDFFTQIVLESSYREAIYTLQNIAVMELDLSSDTTPKVYSFNLSTEKAKFLRDSKNKDDLKALSRCYYKIKDVKISVLPEVMHLMLEGKFYFDYLNKLTKLYIAARNNSRNYEAKINAYQLQILNRLVFNFTTKIDGGAKMNTSEKEMWHVYKKGEEMASLLKSRNAENKISSVSYKLLNSLRIGDTRQFMDVLIRTYMAYGREIPSSFVKALQDKETFYALGYSFLNGLLGESYSNQIANEKEVEEND
ncbi:type I-B CRISPR-associated protein Cas8b1/Cst1 [Hippea sp. KM1]|uniref:type I-B CRISPR-associated protein Cas8b1/Cst1 n=1 Tax=Hippea sp. KM1 TaxID=944481 RepID=UPI00046D5DAB|nr:type I-B CRISPR-associated protein Cas8b1/Cst1 [Hippea sp. KM1]